MSLALATKGLLSSSHSAATHGVLQPNIYTVSPSQAQVSVSIGADEGGIDAAVGTDEGGVIVTVAS